MFLLNRSKLVRDPDFVDDDVIDGGSVSGTPGGDVPSLRGALRGDLSQVVIPIPRVRKCLQFLGLQQIPDLVAADGDMLAAEPLIHQQSVVGETGGLHNEDLGPGGRRQETLRPRKTVDYQDKRTWNRKALLANCLEKEGPDAMTLAEDAEIEFASSELTEDQRRVVSTASDLNGRASFTQVLDFLEEVLLASASGSGSKELVLAKARQLLGASGDILNILGSLRNLVADSDLLKKKHFFFFFFFFIYS